MADGRLRGNRYPRIDAAIAAPHRGPRRSAAWRHHAPPTASGCVGFQRRTRRACRRKPTRLLAGTGLCTQRWYAVQVIGLPAAGMVGRVAGRAGNSTPAGRAGSRILRWSSVLGRVLASPAVAVVPGTQVALGDPAAARTAGTAGRPDATTRRARSMNPLVTWGVNRTRSRSRSDMASSSSSVRTSSCLVFPDRDRLDDDGSAVNVEGQSERADAELLVQRGVQTARCPSRAAPGADIDPKRRCASPSSSSSFSASSATWTFSKATVTRRPRRAPGGRTSAPRRANGAGDEPLGRLERVHLMGHTATVSGGVAHRCATPKGTITLQPVRSMPGR